MNMEEKEFAKKIEENRIEQYYDMEDCTAFEGNPAIEGYDFEKGFDLGKFLGAYGTTGFQASNLARAIEICKVMRREGVCIFLSFTSNMISSGIREVICYLVKNKMVDVLVTSAGAIEEDVIKCFKPFRLGTFNAPGAFLFEKGVNRTGNLFVPNDRYTYFDKFMRPFLEECYKEQKEKGTIWTPNTMICKLGEDLEAIEGHESSVLYHAAKNKIPIYCPGLIDGAFGDMIVYFKQQKQDFILDVAGEVYSIVRFVLNCQEGTGFICLGGGISKHFALNANIFREGFDYAVYINTGMEFDGSDSGANPDEAVTWGKIKVNGLSVKVTCDATIAFPLLVAGAFIEDKV